MKAPDDSCRGETCRQQQRDRILQAAQQCFIKHGFHAASMSAIADTAGMSAGLIYRYFENKSAIIQAIIERQLGERCDNFSTLHTSRDLEQRIVELFNSWRDGDPSVMNAPLFLEIVAESSRDQQIARAFDQSDETTRVSFMTWLQQVTDTQDASPGKDDALKIRSFALQTFIEGLAIRAVREPQIDAALLRRTISFILPHLLDPDSTIPE